MILDPEYGVGAYKISGGVSGGFFGASDIVTLFTGYMGLILKYNEVQMPDGAGKALVDGVQKAIARFGAVITSVMKAVELAQKCGGLGSFKFNFMLTIHIASTISLLALTVSTGGIAGVALNSLLGSLLSVISDTIQRVLAKDIGCK
jgi:uncharacterized protein YaaW (UPF0174 family)